MPDTPEDLTTADQRKAELATTYQFDRCCRAAFDVVLGAWERYGAGGETGPDDPSVEEVALALDHGPVAPALVDWALGAEDQASPSLAAFTTGLIESSPTPHAGAHFVRALQAEADGRVLDAEADFTAALEADRDYTPAVYELARFASDRGDIDRAIALYRRVGPGTQAEVGFLGSLVPDYSGTGRNEPCPCGSGRKFKQCHLGSSEVPADRAALWLFQKVLGFGYREQFASIRTELATTVLDAALAASDPVEEPDREASLRRFENEPFILDLAVFEAGIIGRFADERAVLLPPGEIDVLRSWIATDRRLWEVAEVEVGRRIVFRDVLSEGTTEVAEKVASKAVRPGELLLARIVSVHGTTQLIGQPVSVRPYERESTIAVIESNPDAAAWATWFGQRLATGTARNEEDEPLVIRAAVVRPSDGVDAAALLDAELEPDEVDGRWIEVVDIDGAPVVRARVDLEDDGRMVVATNSDPRMARVLDRLRSADPGLVVEGDESAPFHETDLDTFAAEVLDAT